MDDNAKTLQAYEEDAQGYIDKTPPGVTGDKKAWIELALSKLPDGAKILELGSGFGRDADYIESQGFRVQRSEAARSFIKIMTEQGHTPMLLDAVTGDYGGVYDLIFANAVLLHFSKEETGRVLRKVYDSLVPGGFFAFRLKAGEGSEWDNSMKKPRLMVYWRPDELKREVIDAGFELPAFQVGHSKFNKFTWLQVIARRPKQ